MVGINTNKHSPLGGSTIERVLKCSGSVRLSYKVPDDNTEFSAPGLVAHTLGSECLSNGIDAWPRIGEAIPWRNGPEAGGILQVDKEMADAVQVYLNAVRSRHSVPEIGFIEHQFHCPRIHKYMWGRVDFATLGSSMTGEPARYRSGKSNLLAHKTLHVWDFKYGAGVVVEVVQNPQCKYYAIGLLESLELWDDVDRVVLHIAQPRGFHFDGPLRHWTITTEELHHWMMRTLVPAMDNALVSTATASGEHCRFCPARARACPQLMKDFNELEELIVEMTAKGSANKLDNKQVGRILDLWDVLKIAGKAANTTAFGRLSAGKKIPNRKLVKAKANREWKAEAEKALRTKFGKAAHTLPELKSPAQIEKLPEGEKYTTRYAFKPDKGLTVVSEGESRIAVAKDVQAMFKKDAKKKDKK